jgi:hypothetical protein
MSQLQSDIDGFQSKWDADNLHRHHDYAPVKKEAMPDEEASNVNGDSNHSRSSEQPVLRNFVPDF